MNDPKYEVTYTYGDNPCIHIANSHLVSKKKDIIGVLNIIHLSDQYCELKKAGYTRTYMSEYREWKAHNILYRLGIMRKRTGTVDISQKESKLRRFGYAILSLL